MWAGKDNGLLDALLDFYAPNASLVVDVCCNERRMWRGSRWGDRVVGFDRDSSVKPDAVASWDCLPISDRCVDVLVYDPPHLPVAAASERSMNFMKTKYGLQGSVKADNIATLHGAFLSEALRVLQPDGLIFAKIKDYVHNHRYQWNLEYFNAAVLVAGLTPCDLVIKRDPCGGNLKSGRWKKAHHVKNVHCYWVIVRNGRCEPRRANHA